MRGTRGSASEMVPSTARESPTLAEKILSFTIKTKTAVLIENYVPEKEVFIEESEFRNKSHCSVRCVRNSEGFD